MDMMKKNKANPAEAVKGKLEGEKARNKYAKSMSGYKSDLAAAKKTAKDAFLTKDAMDAKKKLKEAAAMGGKFGNLSAKKEATLGRAKKIALKNSLKGRVSKMKDFTAKNSKPGNPNE